MSLRSWTTGATLLFSALSTSACGAISADDIPALRVEVQNNVSPPAAVTIYAESPYGSRPLLGTVEANSTRTLRSNLTEGEYRLVAHAADGTRTYSHTLRISGGDRWRWDVRSNALTRSDAR